MPAIRSPRRSPEGPAGQQPVPLAPRAAQRLPWRWFMFTAGPGLLALVLGLLVYLADRDPGRAALLDKAWALPAGGWFGAAGGWLPSLLHTLGFGLLSAAALAPRGAAALGACAGWAAVNGLFEVAQHPAWQSSVAQALATLPDPTGAAEAAARYVARGRFDPWDLAAAVAGAVLSMSWLSLWPDGQRTDGRSR